MTYTVIGRCPRNGNLGIGIATYSLAVGATCPWFAPGRGALSTQAFTNPDLGPAGVELLGAGRLPEEVISELRRLDAEFEYRQIAVLDRSGSAAAHSGKRIRQWAGHVIGDGVIAMGNGLAGGGVIEAMAGAFAASESLELAGRLMSMLEAGRDGTPEARSLRRATTCRSGRPSCSSTVPALLRLRICGLTCTMMRWAS